MLLHIKLHIKYDPCVMCFFCSLKVRVLRMHAAANVRHGRSEGQVLLLAQGGRDDRREELSVQAPRVHEAAELWPRGRPGEVLLVAQAGKNGERCQSAMRVPRVQETGEEHSHIDLE